MHMRVLGLLGNLDPPIGSLVDYQKREVADRQDWPCPEEQKSFQVSKKTETERRELPGIGEVCGSPLEVLESMA